jgi:hypothetical protein
VSRALRCACVAACVAAVSPLASRSCCFCATRAVFAGSGRRVFNQQRDWFLTLACPRTTTPLLRRPPYCCQCEFIGSILRTLC